MRTRVRRQEKSLPSAPAQEKIRQELAWAAGTEQFSRRDPLYHVTESFQQTFDRIGTRHAASLDEERGCFRQEETPDAGEEIADLSSQKTERTRTLPNTQIALQTFSETAFQRGQMSAAVLQGTGKMMLVSCLKRTIGQSGPERIQEQTLFHVGSQRRNLPGRDPDQMLFHRGVARGAVGLVVDTLRDAHRTVQSLEEMVNGTGEMRPEDGGETLRILYPFLDDSRERSLLEQYQTQLSVCKDPREVPVLQNAIVHTRALLDKKAQMKVEFTNKLRFLSDRAIEALEEFTAPDFLEEITTSLLQPEWEEEELPPDEGDGPNGRNHEDQPSDQRSDPPAGPSSGTEGGMGG